VPATSGAPTEPGFEHGGAKAAGAAGEYRGKIAGAEDVRDEGEAGNGQRVELI
jgi:hypothetical protein